MRGNDNKEIEARFLEIDPTAIKNRLNELGAKDIEEGMLDEVIFYDNELNLILQTRCLKKWVPHKLKLYKFWLL